MTATITLNTAPHRKARITFRHGSLPYRAVFRIHTMKTIGIVKAEIKRTPRKYGESAKPANVAPVSGPRIRRPVLEALHGPPRGGRSGPGRENTTQSCGRGGGTVRCSTDPRAG